MKEKLKNFFKDKKLWRSFVELLATILIVFISFFSGFAYGVTIDDEIRDEFITDCFPVSNTEHSSLNIVIDKKSAFIPNEDLEYVAIPQTDVNNIFIFDINYLFNTIIEYDSFTDIFNLIGSSQQLFRYSYSFNGVSYQNNVLLEKTSSSDYNMLSIKIQILKNGSVNSTLNMAGLRYSTDSSSYLSTSFNNLGLSISLSSFIYYSSNYSNTLALFDFGIGIFEITNLGGASASDLEQAYQQGFNIGYQSGEIEGVTQFKLSQEFKDILNNEYQDGINKGKEIRDEEYAQTDTVFTKIWTFLRDTISTTLSIFNIQIMPGIPLYFIVVIPIVIGLILWLFKLLQR